MRRSPPVGRRALPAPAVLGLSLAAYLALAVVLWWQAWSTHPSGVTICGCEDPSITTWFLAWPAHALAHGQDPFSTTALFHPTGVNLLSNTGMLAIGIPLAPVTWLWGPVATLDVASTLAPALSALSMCWLLRRWVRWAPAAFAGGLLFGFSPFAVANLAMAHLNMASLALLPLMVACLDELLVRQRHRAVVAGGALGLLAVVQFFVSTEILAIVVVVVAAGLVLATAYAAVADRAGLAARAPHAAAGLATALGAAAVLLAYPLWFALAGPAHLSGRIWPAGTTGSPLLGSGPLVLSDLWHLRLADPTVVRYFAGYQGPALPSPGYLGVGLLVVLAAGLVAFHRDRRLWCFGAVGVASVLLALGGRDPWAPWRALAHLPLLRNVIPGRFMTAVTLCAAVMLGVVVDRTRDAVLHVAGTRIWRRTGTAPTNAAPRVTAGVVALAVAAVALVPPASALSPNAPLTLESVTLPRWFTSVAPSLPPGRVVMTFPLPITGGSAMTWQAVEDFPFALATGAGPGSIPRRAGAERAGQAVLVAAGSLFAALAPPTPGHVASVRQALAGWRVTTAVVPDPSVLVPPADRRAATAWALGYLTLALGRGPARTAGSWVWSGVRSPAARRTIGRAQFDRCTQPSRLHAAAGLAVPACVLARSVPAR